MLGFKKFNAANYTIAGIEAIAMLHKDQSVFSKAHGRVLSIAEQIKLLIISVRDGQCSGFAKLAVTIKLKIDKESNFFTVIPLRVC